MLASLAKRWFLFLLLAGLGLAWTQPCLLGGLVSSVRSAMGCRRALGLMAMSLDSQALLGALRRPWPVLWAVAISYGLLPLLACAAGWVTPNPDLRLGLLLIASVPCTLSSAVLWTAHGGRQRRRGVVGYLADYRLELVDHNGVAGVWRRRRCIDRRMELDAQSDSRLGRAGRRRPSGTRVGGRPSLGYASNGICWAPWPSCSS